MPCSVRPGTMVAALGGSGPGPHRHTREEGATVAYPFTPPNRAALWASLMLTKAQLAALCGLSERQVGYWAAQGYLPHSPRDPERYGGDAVDMAILIKQGRQQGLSAHHAAEPWLPSGPGSPTCTCSTRRRWR